MIRKVLVVDDNAINRQLLRYALSKDYEIMDTSDGEEALRLIGRSYKMLSAVLLDIQMPVMDGFEVLKRMRENSLLSQIPVIVVTGSEDDETRVKALSLGANDFVTKPCDPEIVKHCLRNNIALRETASIVNAIQKDRLTGILNREFFFEKAEDLIKSAEPGAYILACIDIDNFKLVNDQYGTTEGDRILKFIASALRETFDHVHGLCGRISGDNFASLYPNTKEAVAYVTAGHGVRYLPKDASANLSVSVGRYVVLDTDLPASALYDRAFIAKQSVKGRYDKHIAYFDESMLEALVREQQIISDMDAAIAHREFEVWFQPQYNHETGALIGAEALARWRHGTRGLVPPGDFIPVFERNGFIYELDKYIWEETCRYMRRWLDEGRTPIPVSVNVSRYDVFREDMLETLIGLIKKYEIPVSLLRLEITESAFSKSGVQIIAVVERLLSSGFTVEIDDFGSGYSSLNTLKDVPAQIIKLDMRFLEDTKNTRRGGNILESVVRMAKWLDMDIIAEGVETVEQADFLRTIGCSSLQGYLYARPMPVQAFEALMDASHLDAHTARLKTVDNLDNNAFWDPHSIDTLIFNNYVGGACIFEYHDGRIEFLRVNKRYVQLLGGASAETLMKLEWLKHMEPEAAAAFEKALISSAHTLKEFTAEYRFLDVPDCPPELYLRSTIRVVAHVEGRYLVYCMTENITGQRAAEKKLRRINEQIQAIVGDMNGGVAVIGHDWIKNAYECSPQLPAGTYDEHKLWHILLPDMAADTATIKQMQEMIQALAADQRTDEKSLTVRLKTPDKAYHPFCFRAFKAGGEFGPANLMLFTLRCMDEAPESAQALTPPDQRTST